MSTTLIEQAIGVVNNVNRRFRTPSHYVGGSTRVLLNGVLQPKSDHTELGWGKLELKKAPKASADGADRIDVLYTPL